MVNYYACIINVLKTSYFCEKKHKMSFKKALIFLFLSLFSVCFANNDKYRLIITDNPSTTIMIGWNQISGSSPVVYYGKEDFGTDWQKYPNKKSISKVVYYKLMNNHFAKLTNLQPNTAYYFVIKDSEGVSKRFWFKTASANNDKLSFIAGGDSRNNRDVRQNANKLVSKLKPHAVLFGGDMTNLNTAYEWRDWLDDWQLTTAKDGRMIPIIPARGNHEWSNWVIHNLFNTPSTNVYYAITFGKNLVRSYTLNSEIPAGGFQTKWLKSDLEKNTDVMWKMVQYHKPMRPHVESKSEGNDEYKSWAKLFHQHKVKLVCESDSHTVKSTWPIKPCEGGANCDQGFERDDENGTVYVGEGCWGAPLRGSDDKKSWTRDGGSFNQFKLIFIDERKMEVRTVRVEDVDMVAEVNNDNVFSLPKNLKLWKPANGGGFIQILNNDFSGSITSNIAFTNLKDEGTVDADEKTKINVNVLKGGANVAAIEFKIDGETIFTDKEVPFSTDYSFADGRHKIEAIAYNQDKTIYDAQAIYVNAGDFSGSVAVQISSSKDDVEEGIDSEGDLYYTSSDLEMGYDLAWTFLGTSQYTGLRFQNINIPKGAQIKNAYIQFTSKSSEISFLKLAIAAHDVNNAEEFAKNYDVSSRKRTKSVTWYPKSWLDEETSEFTRTPDLSSQVQSLVNKKEWKSGNNMSFVIWDSYFSIFKRRAYTYDADKSKAPKLVINYEFKGSEEEEVDSTQSTSINVYPNPFTNYLTVSSEQSRNIEVNIYNLSGRKLYSNFYAIENKKVKINTEFLVRGRYLMVIVDQQNNSVIKKQIVKN